MFGCHNPYTPYMLWNIYLNKPTCTININQMQVNIPYMAWHGLVVCILKVVSFFFKSHLRFTRNSCSNSRSNWASWNAIGKTPPKFDMDPENALFGNGKKHLKKHHVLGFHVKPEGCRCCLIQRFENKWAYQQINMSIFSHLFFGLGLVGFLSQKVMHHKPATYQGHS